MDAQFIRGMLNNSDVQPNATINRWIAAIHLFDFKLVHIPVQKHHGPDGLSRCELAEGEDKEDDPEDWIDLALSLGLWITSWLDASHSASGQTVFLAQAYTVDHPQPTSPNELPFQSRSSKLKMT